MRSAISPRLAMRIFWNNASFQNQQGFAVLDRRTVGHQDARGRASLRRPDLVERLHRLDQQQRLSGGYALTDSDERRRTRLGEQIDHADHRAEHGAGMAGRFGFGW